MLKQGNFRTGCNFFITIVTPCVTCVALFLLSSGFCIPNFGVLVIGCVNITVLRLTNLTNRLSPQKSKQQALKPQLSDAEKHWSLSPRSDRTDAAQHPARRYISSA